ncbi:helix-turn-helix transcriptional regulator [Streptantibioticus ferralitis]|uniref:LuxR C-terminal-related transcriptional regulator n=1 Tax=Streptantibioticus ferralitis TaxID=236510 RepID=A0ABT5YT44_9ACTN|nr:LuxR C-terminal-related transcriptional regulator [Streptantibioticus ferralitis]MDF2254729.1 LuxR C-terminal-related transcriptional regulator [Streptantibioticus ferralitis]
MERIPVCVRADDPISQVGVAGALRPRPEVEVLADAELDQAKVALVVTGAVSDDSLRVLRSVAQASAARLVLVTAQIDESDLVSVAEAGVVGVVRRGEATPERLVTVVKSAAAGEGAVPPDLLGGLLGRVGRVQRQVLGPRGLNFNDLTDREVEVLRLVAEGFDTAEIAAKVAYSPRTVKQVLHDIQNRYQLRNRCHAVAYAMRHGLI